MTEPAPGRSGGHRVGIVADDLTGAIDAASAFMARHYRARILRLGVRPSEPVRVPVAAFDTDSRACDSVEAWGRLQEATSHPAIRKADVLFKKIDSTLRGQPARETADVLALLKRDLVVVTPAHPAQGRLFVDGALWVHGKPVSQTRYARDDSAPASAKPLAAQFQECLPAARVVTGVQPPVPLEGEVTVWVADASTPEELTGVAAFALAHAARGVIAGAAGLAGALAELLARVDHPTEDAHARPSKPPRLFVVGSRADESRRQIERLCASGGGHLWQIDPTREPGGELVSLPAENVPVVLAPHPAIEASPAQVARALARAAHELVDRWSLHAVFACGGDTAGALLDSLGVKSFGSQGEVTRGVCRSLVRYGSRTLEFFTKPGGFGDENVLLELLAQTQRAAA
ncbi:MAG: hypothetical protein KA712_02435 [Myxococcales bacterium]|nr:hypothetical protein [Myxococcales bacterium]